MLLFVCFILKLLLFRFYNTASLEMYVFGSETSKNPYQLKGVVF